MLKSLTKVIYAILESKYGTLSDTSVKPKGLKSALVTSNKAIQLKSQKKNKRSRASDE